MSASAITGILDGRSLRGVTGARGVWRIRGGGRIGSNLQESLLEAVCREASPYVYYDEAPPTEEVFAGIRANHDGCWQVPQGAHGTDLLKWLYAGNWQLCITPEPPQTMPDLCRASDDEVRREGVSPYSCTFSPPGPSAGHPWAGGMRARRG